MSIGHVRVLIASALLASGATSLAAPEQDYPGQPTKGRVWVENRGKAEAVAVNLQDVARDAPPLKVEVIGIPAVTITPATSVAVQVRRQTWEYRQVVLASGQNPIDLLSGAGAEGWETTGLALPGSAGTTVLVLKRPR